MAKNHFFPKVLTTAFESLNISDEPYIWEFKNAVDHYSLSLQWPKESKRRKARTKRKVTNYSDKSNQELATADRSKVDQHLRTTTLLSKDSSRTGNTLSGIGETCSLRDAVDARKTDFVKVCKGEYKSYSDLDKVPPAASYLSLDNQKEDFERRAKLSKTGEQDYEVDSTGKHLARVERNINTDNGSSSQIVDAKCKIEISKTNEKQSCFIAEGYDLKGNPSVDEELNEENDEDETLNFKMNKFFEENDKADDSKKKKFGVEEKDSFREEIYKASFAHSYNYIKAEPNYESERKFYGTTGLLINKGAAAERKSENIGFSSVTEHRPTDGTTASDIEEIPHTHEEAVGSQKLEEFKKESVRSFEACAGEMSASKGKTAAPANEKGLDRNTIPVSSLRDTQTHLYSGGYKFDSETDKVNTETESGLENIDFIRRKRVGMASVSVTSSSEFSISLSHIRYRRTLYKKRKSLPRTATDEERSTTTESNSQASNGTRQLDKQQRKVSSSESTRKRPYEVRPTSRKCCCGKEFAKKEEAVRHVLSHCPVNVCFRVYLDIKVNRLIDHWEDEANRVMGREWWQMYKTGFFPNVDKRSPVLREVQNIINEFIQKVSYEKFTDKKGGEFVIFEGLESLPSKENEP